MQPQSRSIKPHSYSESLNVFTTWGPALVGWLMFAIGQPGVAQTADQVPVPEYYGIYAVIQGKLVGIDVPRSTTTPEQIEVKVGQPSSGDEVMQGGPAVHTIRKTVPVLNGDVQFLVFGESSGQLTSPLMVAKELKLEQVSYVRNATVQTGWPKAVQRTDTEEAWDTGATAEFANFAMASGMSNRTLTRSVQLLVKPTKGNSNIAIAVPANQLSPGVYLLSGMDVSLGSRLTLLFAVQPIGEGERATCLNVTYRPPMGQMTRTPCGIAASAGEMEPTTGTISRTQPVAPGSGQSANTGPTPAPSGPAIGSQTAISQRPDSQTAQFQVRHRHGNAIIGTPPCPGILSVYPDGRVTYNCTQAGTSSTACHHFSFPSGDLKQVKVGMDGSLHLASKTQGNFDFYGDRNNIKQAYAAITNASGARQPSASSAPARPGSASPLTGPTSSTNPGGTCSNPTDLGYSLLAAGHLYKVKSLTAADGTKVHVFYDEKGTLVSDPELVKKLVTGAWTRENIVIPPDVRNGTRRVSAILDTSQGLQRYEMIQSALAMAMAEALEAAVTGGASLEKAVPNIGWNFVQSQFATPDTARTVLTLTAQAGLQTSLATYKQLEAVLPPADATALDLPTLLSVKDLYAKAHGLELPEGALASALMPTSGATVVNQYLEGLRDELIPGSPKASAVTLNDLFQLQKKLATLTEANTAFRTYSENLNLVINLAQANDRQIDLWAKEASSNCAMARASH